MKQKIYISTVPSPVWILNLWATDGWLCMLEFEYGKNAKKKIQEFRKYLDIDVIEKSNPILEQTKKQLSEYFAWKRKIFDIPLLTYGTDLQKKTWRILQTIPYGETRSYKEQAIKVRDAKVVRAVANANGKNRIGIIIPCHRVIGSDGSLTWFGGGMKAKQWLLEHEGSFK